MAEILIPFRIEDLVLKPEMAGRIRLSDDMQQTLASLVGYDGVSRRLLRSSAGGVLYVTTPRLDNIIHFQATSTPDNWVGDNKKATEVMVMGHPNNTGLIWARTDLAATVDNAWPLAAKEVIGFTVDNLNNLHVMIENTTEKAIIAYTR